MDDAAPAARRYLKPHAAPYVGRLLVSGSWSFRLTLAETGTPGPPAADASPEKNDATPVWPFYLGAVLIVGVGALWAVRRRT